MSLPTPRKYNKTTKDLKPMKPYSDKEKYDEHTVGRSKNICRGCGLVFYTDKPRSACTLECMQKSQLP